MWIEILALVGFGILFKKIFVVPPELARLPAITIPQVVVWFLKSASFDERYYKLREDITDSVKDGIYRIWLLGKWCVAIKNPEYSRQITSNVEQYPKVILSNTLMFKYLPSTLFFGDNLVGLNGAEWKRHRSVVNRAFSGSFPTERFVESVQALFKQWDNKYKDGDAVSVYPWMQRLTLDVFGKVIFSYDFQSLTTPEPGPYVLIYNDIMNSIFKPINFFFPFLSLIPTRNNLQTRSNINKFRGLLSKMVEERKAALQVSSKGAKEQDLLDMFVLSLDNVKDPKNSLSIKELIDDLAVFFVAGHDTTSNSLSAALFFLARDPQIQEKARQHVKKIMKENPSEDGPNYEQIRQMDYILNIIKESLRLYPSATGLQFRRNLETVNFGNHTIPKDTWLQIDIFGMHRDPTLWTDPDVFNPDRFSSNNPEIKAWMPFGAGSRICLGMNFSLQEQKVALAMLLCNYRFKLPEYQDKEKIHLNSSALLRPEDLDVVFERIEASKMIRCTIKEDKTLIVQGQGDIENVDEIIEAYGTDPILVKSPHVKKLFSDCIRNIEKLSPFDEFGKRKAYDTQLSLSTLGMGNIKVRYEP